MIESGSTLAYLGDAVWSLLVRETLIQEGEGKGEALQKKSVAYVSAKAQASFYDQLHNESFFTEEEEEYFKRGRNAHTGSVPHHTSVSVYRKSTGFEAILGALKLRQNEDRIKEIWHKVRTLKEE
ncbi:MAG: Mini-ribonuclease 3 [Solobacterium sp.]|nr:Mini-ribonuclease 3 [Solobacterium sp.]